MVESGDLALSIPKHTQSNALSTRPETLRNATLAISLWIWIALLCFPLITVDAFEVTGNQVLIYQAAGLLQFAIVAGLFSSTRMIGALAELNHFQAAVVIVVILSVALQFHGPDGSIAEGLAYTLVLLTMIICLAGIWKMPADAVALYMGGSAAVIFAFAFCSVAILGWPEERHLGGMHPNLYGSAMLAGFIFSQFVKGISMAIVRAVCLILAAAVSSRFAIIGCLLAFLVFEATSRPLGIKLFLIAITGIVCLLLFPETLTTVLALNDPARNLDSGFTGRDDLWNVAFAAIADAPFGLGFKRPPLELGGHNGYLRLLTEFGLVGGGLIIFATICIIVMAVAEAGLSSGRDDQRRRMASARAGGLVALAFATFFQPQMFNLGDIHGLSVMLMFFSPNFAGEIRLTPPHRPFMA